jgi:hypothetical protein
VVGEVLDDAGDPTLAAPDVQRQVGDRPLGARRHRRVDAELVQRVGESVRL